jgi:hypothetical protein
VSLLFALKAVLYTMKSEPGMSRRKVDDLLSLMGDDEEMRGKLAEAEVLKSELAGIQIKELGLYEMLAG